MSASKKSEKFAYIRKVLRPHHKRLAVGTATMLGITVIDLGSPLVIAVIGQVFDRSARIVKLKLPERMVAYVKVGQPVEVELAAYPGWRCGYLQARVIKVLPVITPQTTGNGIFYIEAKIENPHDARLSPGMSASGEIDTGQTNWLGRIMDW